MKEKRSKLYANGTRTTKVGTRLKQMRLERHMTQAELGNKMGIADSAIRRYESSKVMPRPKTIERFAYALDCNISDLSEDLGDPIEWDDEIFAESDSPLDSIKKKLPDGFEVRELPGWDDAENANFDMVELVFPDKKTTNIPINLLSEIIDNAMEFLVFQLTKLK